MHLDDDSRHHYLYSQKIEISIFKEKKTFLGMKNCLEIISFSNFSENVIIYFNIGFFVQISITSFSKECHSNYYEF